MRHMAWDEAKEILVMIGVCLLAVVLIPLSMIFDWIFVPSQGD